MVFIVFTLVRRFLLAGFLLARVSLAVAEVGSAGGTAHQAQLQMTHLLFSQVISRYIDEGNAFVNESIAASSERGFRFLLEKKFLLAFMFQWQRTIDQYGEQYPSSMKIFERLLREPGFLHDNRYLWEKTFGIDGQGQFGVFTKRSWFSQKELTSSPKSFRYPEDANQLGLHPYKEEIIPFGYARLPFLLRVLESEKNADPMERSSYLLKEISRMLAYEREDRRIYLQMTFLFLNSSSASVRIEAEKILSLVDANEFSDFVADLKWFAIGGTSAWLTRSQWLESFSKLASRPIVQKIASLLQKTAYFTKNKILEAKTKAVLFSTSVYRSLRAIEPQYWAFTISAAGHLAVYKYFFKGVSKEQLESRQLQENLQRFFGEDSKEFPTQEVFAMDSSIRSYLQESKYAKLRAFNPLPLSLLNQMQSLPLMSPEEMTKSIQAHLDDKTSLGVRFDYGRIFIFDEYYRNLAATSLRDLRLPSMAYHAQLAMQRELKKDLEARNVSFFSQLPPLQVHDSLLAAVDRLRQKHTAYYSRETRSLIRESLGEGGNCVAIAYFQLSILSSLMGEGSWKLGVVFEPSHVRLVAYSREHKTLIQLDDTKSFSLAEYELPVYDPKLFLATIVGRNDVSSFNLGISKPLVSAQQGEAIVRKTFKTYGVDKKSLLQTFQELLSPEQLKSSLQNLINNPVRSLFGFEFPKGAESTPIEDVSEFSFNEGGGGENNPSRDRSGGGSWLKETKESLRQSLKNLKNNVIVEDPAEALLKRFHDIGLLQIGKIELRSPSELNDKLMRMTAIPLLDGKLGAFAIYQKGRGFPTGALFLSSQQVPMLLGLSDKELFQLLLAGFLTRGREIGEKFKELTIAEVNALLAQAPRFTNAGVVKTSTQWATLLPDLFALGHFKWSVEIFFLNHHVWLRDHRFLNVAEAVNFDGSLILMNFLSQISYPANFIYKDGANEVLQWKNIYDLQKNGDGWWLDRFLLARLLLREIPSNFSNPYLVEGLQQPTLAERHLNNCYLGEESLEGELRYGYSGNGFRLALIRGNEVIDSGSVYYSKENSDSSNRAYTFCKPKTKKEGLLELLSFDPREFRANFLMSEFPLSFRDGNHGDVLANMPLSLRERAPEWKLSIPQIQNVSCAPKRIRWATKVNVPKLSKDLCQSLPDSPAGGITCFRAKEEVASKNDQTSYEECDDVDSLINFRVKYRRDKKKSEATSGSGKISVPLENILTLYSDLYRETYSADFLLGKFEYKNREKPKELWAQLFSLEKKFTVEVADHLFKHHDYYERYWKYELSTLCALTDKHESLFAQRLRANGTCEEHQVHPIETELPTFLNGLRYL